MTIDEKRQILAAIEKQYGYLSAELVVRIASDSKHPLHDQLTWDDVKAAHEHRLDEARALIRVVRIHIITDRRQIRTIGYVRNPQVGPHEQGYKGITSVMRSRDDSCRMIANELDRIESSIERAILLADAVQPQIVDELKSLIAILINMRSKNVRKRAA